MAVKSVQVAVPTGASPVPIPVPDADGIFGEEATFRAGGANLWIGGADVSAANGFPLLCGAAGAPGEAWSTSIADGETLYAIVQSGATPGVVYAVKSK